jgi:Haem-NO-binding
MAMMGMVFTEFLDLVESKFSPEVADRIITAASTATNGAYTAVGKYDHAEMVRMVQALSVETKVPVEELLRVFGHHLAVRFSQLYGAFFASQPSLFDFLASVDSKIHVEVRKLYPAAELPSLQSCERTAHSQTLIYRSSRHMHDLALGLIQGAALHFGQTVAVEHAPLPDGAIRFVVKLQTPVSEPATADASAA